MALPLARSARVPAADRGPGARRRRAAKRPPLLQAAHARRVHAGRVPDRRVPDGTQHGAALVPRESQGRQRQRVLRNDLRPRRRGPDGSGRPARRRPRVAAVHRLADLLRLRRRQRQAEQAHRHEDLDAAVQPPARCDREPRHAAGAPATKPAAPADVEPPLRPSCRHGDGRDAARRRRPSGAATVRLPVEHAALVLRAEGGGGRAGRPAAGAGRRPHRGRKS